MANNVLIPTPLRVYAGKKDVVQADGKTVGELLQNLTSQYSDLRNHLYNEDGKLRSFVNVYLNDLLSAENFWSSKPGSHSQDHVGFRHFFQEGFVAPSKAPNR